MFNKRTVGIIGAGHVGSHTAYSIASQGIADEIILTDINHEKAESECRDIFDAMSSFPHRAEIHTGSYSDLGHCSIIVNAAGNISLLSEPDGRLNEARYTLNAVSSFTEEIMSSGFSGIIVSISNPCDIVAERLSELSGLPHGHVIGTGTALDTARLLSVLERQTGIHHSSISACVIGEHGMAQMVPWSAVSFGGRKLSECEETDERFRFDREALRTEARDSWRVLMKGKHSTEYGICSAAARIIRSILFDEKQIIPVSIELDGAYGEDNLFAGVPCVIGAQGAEKIIELPLSGSELKEFHECCMKMRENKAKLS